MKWKDILKGYKFNEGSEVTQRHQIIMMERKFVLSKDHLIQVNLIKLPKEAQNLQIDDYIVGNQCNYKLIDIIQLHDIETMCIATSSNKHIFLICDKLYENWAGDQSFPFDGIYTANTGGGKSICIEQEIDT